jgi:hypothetical protein
LGDVSEFGKAIPPNSDSALTSPESSRGIFVLARRTTINQTDALPVAGLGLDRCFVYEVYEQPNRLAHLVTVFEDSTPDWDTEAASRPGLRRWETIGYGGD